MKTIIKILMLLLIVSCSSQDDIEYIRIDNSNEWNNSDKELLNIIQDYRTNIGLPKLIPNKSIRDIAINRLETVKLSNPISHSGIQTVIISAKELGFKLPKELLAYGYTTNQRAFEALLRSKSHYLSILEDNVYIGVHTLEYNSKNYYIILFAR
jgi:uncharacterized protein YkwD